MKNKKKILIIMGRYLPGYKDGGPVRTIKNLTDYLGKEYDFYVLTCDRDHGDDLPYSDIEDGAWNQVGNAKVWYLKPGGFSRTIIKEISNQVDLIYLCGCFNDYSVRTLILNKFGKITCPVVIASMGLFSPQAFAIKYFKKSIFIKALRLLGIFRSIYWSASSQMEKDDIIRIIKAPEKNIYIAEDLPRNVKKEKIVKKKEKGKLKVVFISRFNPHKNLKQAIRLLKQVKCEVEFVLYGPVENKKYWQQCKEELDKLPANIHWMWKGILDSEKVVEVLRSYHLLLFPTKGENFGHVIQEALSAGCPCIISDQTPWQDLTEEGVGYVLPLKDEKAFINAIENYASMEQEEFQKQVDLAHEYAIKVSNSKVENTGYRKIFDKDEF